MEIKIRKNGFDPKELMIVKKALLRERASKARKDKKQKVLAEDETTLSRRITTDDD